MHNWSKRIAFKVRNIAFICLFLSLSYTFFPYLFFFFFFSLFFFLLFVLFLFLFLFWSLLILIFNCIGSKQDNITVIYTLWSNLKKSGDMEIGQVGFHDEKAVCKERRGGSGGEG